jgi:tetrahydromethanopterin S-methyltransferase subunit A
MLKVNPHSDYPPEEGRYIKGNDFSPVALAVILNTDADKIPVEIERLVRVGIESGAALSGTVQTPNIGFEKMVCNIVANTNIRYLILGGPESEGHSTGDALKALMFNGIDEKKRIIGTKALYPSLFNLPTDFIERFRKQVTLIDLQFKDNPDIFRQCIWSCYQEKPVEFCGYSLFDHGAYPEPPLSGKITWRVAQPWTRPADEDQLDALKKVKEAIEQRLRVK